MYRWKRQFICLLILVVCFLFAGIVFGSWEAQQTTDNFLTMTSYKARIVEKYKVPQHVDPSEEIDKVVNVRNEGTVGILVRVSVEKMFGTRTVDGTFVEDKELNTDVIEITFHDKYWKKGEDGWFYYRDVLEAGETTKEPLMESYRLSEKTGNEYRGKEAQIVVRMESIQAEGNAAESIWKINKKNLGVVWPDTHPEKDTSVAFLNKEEGFEVQADNTDLFASFKNLLPGCTRTQKITVSNDSSEDVEIFLKAREADQTRMAGEQQTLVKQLMEKYAVIRVTEEGNTLYEGAVCGKDSGDSMRSDISLGTFPANSSKELVVSLSLSPQMDNHYESLTGDVVWMFSAQGEDGTVVEKDVPVTGDFTDIGMWAALFAMSGLAMWLAFLAERRNRRWELREMSEKSD